MNEPAYQYPTAEQLLEPLPNGGIKLHEIAMDRVSWDLLDPRIITEAMLLASDGDGNTVAHCLVQQRVFAELPPALITPRVLMARGGIDGSTVLHNLVRRGSWGLVNPRLLTEEMLLASDLNGDTVAHALAWAGMLDKVWLLITPRLLLARSCRSATVLHVLVLRGSNSVLPLPTITPDMLRSADEDEGRTVVKTAIDGRGIWAIAHLLDSEMLMMKSRSGRTALSSVVRNGCLHLVQPAAFRPEWMSRKFQGRTLRQILFDNYAFYLNEHIMEFQEPKFRAAILGRLLAA